MELLKAIKAGGEGKKEEKKKKYTSDLESTIQEKLNIIAKGGIASTQPSMISIDAIKYIQIIN